MPDPKPAAVAVSSELDRPRDPLRQVLAWIVAGQSEADITQAIAVHWPKTKQRALIVAALESLAESGNADPQIIRGFAIEATREIYRRTLDVADHQTALRALKQLVELSRK